METPPWLWNYLDRTFHFDWDACATSENSLAGPVLDALTTDWSEQGATVFMNPPYSKPGPFLSKAAAERRRGVTTVALIKGDPSVSWWNLYVAPIATLKWIPKRVRFYYKGVPTSDVANFPSVLAVYWGHSFVEL